MKRIGIIGAGKIGRTLYDMLGEREGLYEVSIADCKELDRPHFTRLDAENASELSAFIRKHDAVVSAGPFRINERIVSACAKNDVAYFDFTEDTATTKLVKKLSAEADVSFVPQCGLAPGIVNIIAADLIKRFSKVHSLHLRVGALPQTAGNHVRYYLTWSTAGLINEYVHPCDVLFRGEPTHAMPLEGLETIVIDGVVYEAFNTSGGSATMCETFRGQIDTLNYKTLRYPGHCEKMKFLLKDLQLDPKELEDIFNRQLPTTVQDVVIIYVEAIGIRDGMLHTESVVKKIKPRLAPGLFPKTAIQLATAAGMAAVLELWANDRLDSGFVSQERIAYSDVLATYWGRVVYADAI
jgi:saccharopine dehydrogenase-like NADP-dependent oxidoreductase